MCVSVVNVYVCVCMHKSVDESAHVHEYLCVLYECMCMYMHVGMNIYLVS